jgi:hypothetical protein
MWIGRVRRRLLNRLVTNLVWLYEITSPTRILPIVTMRLVQCVRKYVDFSFRLRHHRTLILTREWCEGT